MTRASHHLHLISFDLCPYVERSRIVLAEKGVNYEQTFIDLSDKPDWFLEISPRGKVPVLLVDERPIFESFVINELLEELYPEPALMPDDPIERAEARAWIVFNNDVLMPHAYRLRMADDDRAVAEHKTALREGFERLNSRLEEREEGPYFLGADFQLVDAVYAPMINRWEATEQMGHGDLLDELDQVREYAEALLEHPSVIEGRADNLTERLLGHRT
ncbi:MAG: glutathione S-transferase family protein [Persicimonas sp.]